MALLTLLTVGSALLVFAVWKWISISRHNRIPAGLKKLPGPKGYPIIGSIPDVPVKNGFIKFAEWGKEYGDVYQVNLAGHNHVWIMTDELARNMMAKKGLIYAARPCVPALIEDNRTGQRKFANVVMRESEKVMFHRYPEIEAKRMLVELLEEPDRYNHAMESFVARITCRLAWGHSEGSDELKQRARELLIVVSPTGSVLNRLTFLMNLPDWLVPAKAWERRRLHTEEMFFQIMQAEVEADMREKRAPTSWMRTFLENKSKFGFTYDMEGAFAVGMHGIAGALTIAAPIQTFCLAMCFYPQYLKMLQEELDRVCGDRLPRAEDRPNLPFLRAVIRECLRWRPPVPTGIPHALAEDDEFNGYFIPKGSIIHPLEWSIARDPELFPDPEAFNPCRWVEPSYPTYKEPLTEYPTIINSTQFGYGRRLCQGQTVADEDLLIGIGSIAWLFNLQRNPDEITNSDATTPQVVSDPEKIEADTLGMNKKASISTEELSAGIESKKPTMEDEILSKYSYPGSDPTKPQSNQHLADATLDFTTLLIAKPLPFKFQLKPRDEERVKKVKAWFEEGSQRGDYRQTREYWGTNHGEGKPLGWGKV
ncbi:cytochrome P450 2E1 [Aaosphaeria arxii CBS 175.79]|uniref:Cytochrome P450 2E1 n=1 Tax=Aaosphaeria arxii CBS 175.79 TaxID=1450172 RepID=A0A6A5YAV2_9PLEO|nr:cytochrome P450 2E1 [Aaosphaeria arxii CBS 175.79]KAF2021900.1 cytochrome P450 2E1 [Aaosphaeria arxii CBS 175.79]